MRTTTLEGIASIGRQHGLAARHRRPERTHYAQPARDVLTLEAIGSVPVLSVTLEEGVGRTLVAFVDPSPCVSRRHALTDFYDRPAGERLEVRDEVSERSLLDVIGRSLGARPDPSDRGVTQAP